MKNYLITGVSTGLGFSLLEVLIREGHHVFGSVRKKEDAQRLQDKFGKSFTPLIFDVTDEHAVNAAIDVVEKKLDGNGLNGLINNAGIAVAGPLMHLDMKEFQWQFEVNVFGLLRTTQAFLPFLGAFKGCKHPPGKIYNISSVAGKVTNPFMGAYCSSKHAVEAISTALDLELQLYGIDVVSIGPGIIKTPIWEKAEEFDTDKYEHTDFSVSSSRIKKILLKMSRYGYTMDEFATIMLRILNDPKPKSRYPIVHSPVRNWFLPRFVPKKLFKKLVGDKLGLHNINAPKK